MLGRNMFKLWSFLRVREVRSSVLGKKLKVQEVRSSGSVNFRRNFSDFQGVGERFERFEVQGLL